MEPVLIPSVPDKAFNKYRRISDLVRRQIEHFKHIEEKLPANVRATLPQHAIVTEDDAARYIGPITSYLLSQPRPKPAAKKIVVMKSAAPIRRKQPVDLAAGAAPAGTKSAAKKKSSTKKKSSSKKENSKVQKPVHQGKARNASRKK